MRPLLPLLAALVLPACAPFPTWYADYEIEDLKDRDDDGFQSDEVGGADCDDSNPSVNPGEDEVYYDGLDNDCDEATVDNDQDGDGFVSDEHGGDDCNDEAAAVNPQATEICDEIDNDCDGATDDEDDSLSADTWFLDEDGDGVGAGSGQVACTAPSVDHVTEGGDCDDADDANYPGNDEVCDDQDNNCNTTIDETPVNGIAVYADNDLDGYGDTETTACAVEEGFSQLDGDCDDSDDTVYPGAPEDCGLSVDKNCDGSTGNDDLDNDGFIACQDCNDQDENVNDGATEVCNGVDDDCDGDVDDDDSSVQQDTKTTYWVDDDSDSYGDPTTEQDWCNPPVPLVTNGDDCDDTDGQINPGVSEVIADGIDQDCTGEDLCHVDDDGDGYGLAATTDDVDGDLDCTTGTGVADNDADCNDTDEHTFPGAAPNDDASACLTDADGDDWASETSGGTDCNDDAVATFPGANDTPADGIDQDCNDQDLCYVDLDGDTFGDTATTDDVDGDLDCTTGAGVTDNADDCDDGADYTFPGSAPEDSVSDCMADQDDDDFGDLGASGDVIAGTDCDDSTIAANPGNPFEFCGDGLDNDCDQSTDDTSGCIYDLDAVADADLTGPSGGRFGTTVLYAADPQGTGAPGLWVSAPEVSGGDGAFYLFTEPSGSLTTGNAQVELTGKTDEALGALAGGVVLDNDGDGVDDLAIVDDAVLGTRVLVIEGPFADSDASDVDVATISGSSAADFASAVAAGPLDSDSQHEIAIGAPGTPFNLSADAGAVHVFSGPVSGSLLTSGADALIEGDTTGLRLGEGTAVADLDRDGDSDLLVTGDDSGGKVYGFDAPTGTQQPGDAFATLFDGSASAPSVFSSNGDSNGDGSADLLIADPDFNGSAGKVWLFQDAVTSTGGSLGNDAAAVVESLNAGASFGASVQFVPDLDGDGNDEFLVGAPGFSSGAGAVFLFLGGSSGSLDPVSDGALVLTGGSASNAGASFSAGDLDGDSILDLAIGAPGAASDAGQAFLLFGDTF